MAQYIHHLYTIILKTISPAHHSSDGVIATKFRLYVLILITLIVLFPFAVKANNLFESQLELAKRGDAEAQFNVGQMYEFGFGVMKDNREAIYWITRSANQKHEAAGFKLLYLDIEREGLEGDNKAKVKELHKLAEQGNAQAQYYLGKMYKHGVGVNKNSEVAANWLNKAASAGVLEAEVELASTTQKKQHEEKKKLLMKSTFVTDPCNSKSSRFLSSCR